MNELMIFENEEFYKIKDFQNRKPNSVMGIIYAIEYGNGYSKIGMSSVPASRTFTLKHYISDYMQKPVARIMISTWHTNYRENEKHLHKEFIDCRIPNTELFSVGIDEICNFIYDGGILFEDKSKEIIEKINRRSDALIKFGESILNGDYDFREKNEFNFSKMYDDMLKSSKSLTDEILFTTRVFVDDYRASLEDSMKFELMQLKGYFVDKWIQYNLISEKDILNIYNSREMI